MLINNTNLIQDKSNIANELFLKQVLKKKEKEIDLEKKSHHNNFEEASLTISRETKEQRAEEAILQAKRAVEQMRETLERAKESGDAGSKGIRILTKCIKIAYRIVQGDIVPKEDMYFLMENNPELYRQAITMRMVNDDPKEWDSELEDEDKETELGMPTKGEHKITLEVEPHMQTEGTPTES